MSENKAARSALELGVALAVGALTFGGTVGLALVWPEIVRFFTGPSTGGIDTAITSTTVVIVLQFATVVGAVLAYKIGIVLWDRRRRHRTVK